MTASEGDLPPVAQDDLNRDVITGLKDLHGFFEAAETLHANAQRGNLSVAIARLHIDRFGRIEEEHGHEAGDAVLRRAGRMLRDRFRRADVVGCLGRGDFCVLAANLARQQAHRLFEEVRRLVEGETVHHAGAAIELTVSIGINLDQNESLEAMLAHAEEKLGTARQAGGNRIEL